jgi:pyruvate,water dikinase
MAASTLLWLKEIHPQDDHLTGKYGLQLARLRQNRFPIPDGFIITPAALSNLVQQKATYNRIQEILKDLKPNSHHQIQDAAETISKLLVSTPLLSADETEIIKAYLSLKQTWFSQPLVSIHPYLINPSKTNHQKFSPIQTQGESNLVLSLKQIWGLLFLPSQLYTHIKKISDLPDMAILVQQSLASEISGKISTIDPVTGQKNLLNIEAVYGHLEIIEQDTCPPDLYQINKFSRSLISKRINVQNYQYISLFPKLTKIKIKQPQAGQQKLTDQQIISLFEIAFKAEQQFLEPLEINWFMFKNQFYINDLKPLTIIKNSTGQTITQQIQSHQPLKVLTSGIPASPGLKTGHAYLYIDQKKKTDIKKGQILIISSPKNLKLAFLRKAGAIVSDQGSLTSQLAILARELGLPCVVGAGNATSILKNHQLITIDGKHGKIYQGAPKITKTVIHLQSETHDIDKQISDFMIQKPVTTATQIDCSISETENIADYAALPLDGVGLVNAGAVLEKINIHPQHLIETNRSADFTNQLTEFLLQICQSFQPRPVVYQLSDLLTTDYLNLKWGNQYEPLEQNPLLGRHGALRLLGHLYQAKLEIQAIKKIRHQHRLLNLQLMLPTVRSTHELIELKKMLASYRLARTPTLKYWLTVSLPGHLALIEHFDQQGIDGLAINYSLLTQLLLGTDRKTDNYQKITRRSQIAIDWAIIRILKTAHKLKIPTTIYGQGFENNSDLIEKLIKQGVTRITIPPSLTNSIRDLVSHAESRNITTRI